MTLNYPTCKTPLEHNDEAAHYVTYDRDSATQAPCPEYHQALRVLEARGAVDYFCQHGHGSVLKKRVEFVIV